MILKKPLITEKMTAIMDKRGQYGFIVDPKSTKDEIKAAIEEFYAVEVASVNTGFLSIILYLPPESWRLNFL